MQTLIHHATLVLPDRLIEGGWLLIEDKSILDLGEEATCPGPGSHTIDGEAGFLLPGLIDLHCDAIERLVEPRPKVHFDIHIALQEADYRLAGSGITCEFHAVSLNDDEFGVRTDKLVRDLSQILQEDQEEHLIRHKLHARLELSSERGNAIIEQMIAQRECDLISLMDHSPGQGQYPSEKVFREYMAFTTNRSDAEIDLMLEMKRSQQVYVPARITRITNAAREAGLAIATHDDDTASKVEQWPELGVSISEFPTTMEAAQRAHELGLAVCMGAPNVVRGRSSGGNLSASEGIKAGVVDVLCADYHPSSMLGAVFGLTKQQILPLPEATRLVTLNPACAVHLDQEYGSLEIGKVADMILVQPAKQGFPRVQRLFLAGEEKLKLA
ncbi:alpha-D-ribose 1-methylphosphonate 5-triphosphate diphosphatase [Dictyobacter formicarum]|uniref:Amidohydrolase n=1 Tax=Dictyobacter formicarum TaxID=2778368 RepID=A0ABQ3VCN2_9CHLR|nr:alpha-D-ribose 1-methylphosphonate 5-triphosphate diphosphatase [Dictyobacter formicarum]GHO83897.1 amidohydrolase [Dictyobacter formicarum]